MNILIVNYIANNVVSAVRTFSKLGYNVDIAVPTKCFKEGLSRYFRSKYINKQFSIHSPVDNFRKFENDLLKLLNSIKYDCILPFGFATTVAISKIKNRLNRYTNIGVADYNIINLAHDKEKLQLHLTKNGFQVPKIYEYKRFSDLKCIDLKFPIVIKARKGCGVEKGVRYAKNFNELKYYYNEITMNTSMNTDLEDFSKPLIQEYIPGKIHDALFLFNKGKMKAALTQIREVTYPLSGGVGVNNITTYEPELIKYGKEILEFINWHGPCQVEVKKDTRDGKYKLIEINPKLWGTLDLSIKAGINFAVKTLEIAMNGDTREQYKYTVGLKYKFIFPLEIYTIYQDKGNRLKRIKKLLEIFDKNTFTEFDINDLKPNIYNILSTFNTVLRHNDTILPKGREFY